MKIMIICNTQKQWDTLESTAIGYGYVWQAGGDRHPELYYKGRGLVFSTRTKTISWSRRSQGYTVYTAEEMGIQRLDMLLAGIGAGNHTVRFDTVEQTVEIGCLQVSFDEVRKVQRLIEDGRGTPQPVRIGCKNEIVFRGVESMLLSQGYVWNARPANERLGRVARSIVLRDGTAETPMSLLTCLHTHPDQIDPETEPKRLAEAIQDNAGSTTATTVGGRRVVVNHKTRRVVSVQDKEGVTFEDVKEIHDAVEKLTEREDEVQCGEASDPPKPDAGKLKALGYYMPGACRPPRPGEFYWTVHGCAVLYQSAPNGEFGGRRWILYKLPQQEPVINHAIQGQNSGDVYESAFGCRPNEELLASVGLYLTDEYRQALPAEYFWRDGEVHRSCTGTASKHWILKSLKPEKPRVERLPIEWSPGADDKTMMGAQLGGLWRPNSSIILMRGFRGFVYARGREEYISVSPRLWYRKRGVGGYYSVSMKSGGSSELVCPQYVLFEAEDTK
jgi:hypothetical protein